MTQPTCKTCKWWDSYDKNDVLAECHRFPPQVLLGKDGMPCTCWAETEYFDVCGEHQPMDTEEQNPITLD